MTTRLGVARAATVVMPAVLALCAGCGSKGSAGASAGPDAGADARAGADSGAAVDAGAGADTGAHGDAGPPGDAGAKGEGGQGTDGGTVGDSTGVTASPVSRFLGSLGVCTHVAQGVDDPTKSATALSYLGVSNIRDDGNPVTVPSWITMHQASGVRLSLLTNQDVASTVSMADQLAAAGALLDVEGPNEPNNFPVTYGGQTSGYTTTFVPVAQLQRDLYAAVKADTKLAGIPVFHSSEAGGSEPDDVGLQFLTIPAGAGIAMPDGTKYADYANVHNYVTGHSGVLSDDIAWNASDPTLNGDWDGLYVEYGHTWHGGFAGYANADLLALPRVTTETGWVTTGTGAITEEQQARLFLDLYAAAFARGFSYTFIYMLRDDPAQGYWGLVDTSYAPKTSGTYLHRLTTILADAGTGGVTPGKLDYAVTSEPANVHDLLLQKSDGTFELVVWDERFTTGSDTVTVDLKKVRPSVKVYDPTTGTTPVQTLSAVSTVSLTLSDHPNVLEL
ncbi:MAG TPA: hypothetical protein VIY73_00995 [Polyangiaceae bacterium]